jgi:hypothetical protein
LKRKEKTKKRMGRDEETNKKTNKQTNKTPGSGTIEF